MIKVVIAGCLMMFFLAVCYGQGTPAKPLQYPNNPAVHQDIVSIAAQKAQLGSLGAELRAYAQWRRDMPVQWSADSDNPAQPEFYWSRNAILEGAWEEDVGARALNHFWNPQAGFTSGLDILNDSAPQRADGLFKEAVAAYARGDKYMAYYKLGRVAHLLADVSVPAHVKLDPHPLQDSYELLTGLIERRDQDDETGGMAQFIDPSVKLDMLTYENVSPRYDQHLANLFWSLASYADGFDTDEVDGTEALGFFRHYCVFNMVLANFIDSVTLDGAVLVEGKDYMAHFKNRPLVNIFLSTKTHDSMVNHNGILKVIYKAPLGTTEYTKANLKTPKQVNDMMFPGAYSYDSCVFADVLEDVYTPELITRAELATEELFRYFLECTQGTITVLTAGPQRIPVSATADVNGVVFGLTPLVLHYTHKVDDGLNPPPVTISVLKTYQNWVFDHWIGAGIASADLKNPKIKVWPDGDLTFTACYKLNAPEGPAVEYLLGMGDAPTDMDKNHDGKTDIADVIATLKK